MMVSKQHLTDKGRSQIKLIQSNMNTKRKYINKGFSILNSQLNFIVLLIIFIGFTLLNIPYVINSDLFISMINTDYLTLNINNSDTIKGSLEVKNVKIENVDIAVEKVRDGAIYIGGMAAAAKIMKSISKRNLKFEFVQKLPLGPYLQTLLIKLFN